MPTGLAPEAPPTFSARESEGAAHAEEDSRAVLVRVRFTAGEHSSAADPNEIGELAKSASLRPVATITASRPAPHARWFIGPGKLEELAGVVRATGADIVVFDHELSPAQARNVARHLGCPVLTRTELILRIFAARARTHEGKLQVELAQLTHAQTRLVRGWTHLDRQTGVGGGGGRGAGGRIGGSAQRGVGETQLELDQRMLAARLRQVRRGLEDVRRQRSRSRRRRSRARVPTVALAGYTNAGKSTLFNALTDSAVPAEDRLFATLDPTLRRLAGVDAQVVLADTVGFIRALPVALVEAFKATLEEVTDADLILHVIDAADPDAEIRREAVEAILAEIGAGEVPTLRVRNKIDLVAAGNAPWASGADIGVSALTGDGVAALKRAITACLGLDPVVTEVRLPVGDGRARSWLYRNSIVEGEHVGDSGETTLNVRVSRTKLAELRTLQAAR